MALSSGPDRAAIWVRKTFPDDDYLPPDVLPTRKGQVCGHLPDDEGTGPEAVAWAETLARPEARRSREREWRTGTTAKVRKAGGGSRSEYVTWTLDAYTDPVAPPAGIRPDQTIRLRHPPREVITGWQLGSGDWGEPIWIAPWDGDGIDLSLYTRDEFQRDLDADPDDQYSELAYRYVDYRGEDDRPEWHRDLEQGAGDMVDQPGFDDDPEVWDMQTETVEPVVMVCENPKGCDLTVRASHRCNPCYEYRRTHNGAERPERLINRDKHRRGL